MLPELIFNKKGTERSFLVLRILDSTEFNKKNFTHLMKGSENF